MGYHKFKTVIKKIRSNMGLDFPQVIVLKPGEDFKDYEDLEDVLLIKNPEREPVISD